MIEENKEVSKIENEKKRGRFESKVYKLMKPVWVTEIKLHVKSTYQDDICQICEFGILTTNDAMAYNP